VELELIPLELDAEAELELARADAEGELELARADAEGELELAELDAEGELELAELDAEGEVVAVGRVCAAAVCVDPGSAKATAPAAATLATLSAAVVERTLARPRSLASVAPRITSRCELLMYPILRSRARNRLHEGSQLTLSWAKRWPYLFAGYLGNGENT
jgi:hypothetical protein